MEEIIARGERINQAINRNFYSDLFFFATGFLSFDIDLGLVWTPISTGGASEPNSGEGDDQFSCIDGPDENFQPDSYIENRPIPGLDDMWQKRSKETGVTLAFGLANTGVVGYGSLTNPLVAFGIAAGSVGGLGISGFFGSIDAHTLISAVYSQSELDTRRDRAQAYFQECSVHPDD